MPERSFGVLIVDDESAARNALACVLEREGYRAWTAGNGAEALAAVRAVTPDLVLLDVSMPGIDGVEVCKRMHGGTEAAPLIVFVSAIADRDSRIEALEAGAVDYVVKPFDVNELLARIRAQLRTKSRIDALADDACTDPLTGLANRAHLQDRAVEWIAAAERYGRGLACAMIDIDRFKAVNDCYGHEAGDAVLREVAHRLQRVCRQPDALIRYGGEEFLLVAPESSPQGARMLAERVRRRIVGAKVTVRALRRWEELTITISVGVALWQPGMTPEQIIRRADDALLQAKRNGRNRVVVG